MVWCQLERVSEYHTESSPGAFGIGENSKRIPEQKRCRLLSVVHGANINEKMAYFTAKASRGELKE